MRKLPWLVWVAMISANAVGSISPHDEAGYRTESGLWLSTNVFINTASVVSHPLVASVSSIKPKHKHQVQSSRANKSRMVAMPFKLRPLALQGQSIPHEQRPAARQQEGTFEPESNNLTDRLPAAVTYTVPNLRVPTVQAQASSPMTAARPPIELVGTNNAPNAPSTPSDTSKNGSRPTFGRSAYAHPNVNATPNSQNNTPSSDPLSSAKIPSAPTPSSVPNVPDIPVDNHESTAMNSGVQIEDPVVAVTRKSQKKKKAKKKTKAVVKEREAEEDDSDFERHISSVPVRAQPKMLTNQEAITEDAIKKSHEWIDSKDKFTYGEDGKIVYTYGVGMPVIVCAPMRITDLELEPGERVNGSIHAGDSTRWMISPAESGSGPDSITHLIIKPREAGLETNVIIPTDRRVYHMKFVSSEKDYVARIAFSYPDQVKRQWNNNGSNQQRPAQEDSFRGGYGLSPQSTAGTAGAPRGSMGGYGGGAAGMPANNNGGGYPAVDNSASANRVSPMFPERLYFDYEIIGRASWRPVRVFDDGQKTFIQVPPEARNGEIPALMIIGADQTEQLVNYRFRDNYYIVDRIFNRAVLLIGVGRDQQKVIIKRVATQNSWSASWDGGSRSNSGGD
ncbi:MAG: TrbG/VirB9 family P-type conjugative transfer protein [Pseudomonadota bacterium]